MTNIDEGNKIIAEFMNEQDGVFVGLDEKFNDRFESIPYHASWNWLMPVVEKIEGIKNSDDYEVDIFSNCCDIGGKFEATGKTKIEATWRACIQFIQWYNNQNK